jgi:hypothetical protein
MLPPSRNPQPRQRPVPQQDSSSDSASDCRRRFKETKSYLDKTSVDGYCSYRSTGACFGCYSIFGILTIFSVASVNCLVSIISVNSVLSIGSINSIGSVGCLNRYFEVCWLN